MTRLSKSGFSLIEVLIALVVLTIGVFALARSMAAMNHLLGAGTVLTRVSLIGTNQMERLLAAGCNPSLTFPLEMGGVTVTSMVNGTPASMWINVELRYPLDYVSRIDSLQYVLGCPRVE